MIYHLNGCDCMEKIIEIKDLCFAYGEENVINNLNLTLPKGKWITILGHNGSGKSTLSKLIIGLLRPKSGEIIVDNIPLSEETVYEIRKKAGIVFQNPDNQFVGTTVKEDIAFGMENRQITRDEMINRINEIIKKVDMEEYINTEPHHLSGGQKQRVAIAGALALNSDLLILDEATSMLDPQGRNDVVDLIKKLRKNEKSTIISITHEINEAILSDYVVVMNKGEVVLTGEPKEVFTQEETLLSSGLELPLAVRVSNTLKEKGIISDTSIYTDELVERLCQLNSQK